MNLVDKKEFKGIDIAKFVMAVLVVAIHTHPFERVDNPAFIKIWDVIVSVAVPYFFIASGFFLFKKVDKEPDQSSRLIQIASYGKRIARLYVYWTIIFLPITIWKFVNNDEPFYKDVLLFLRGFFLFGENHFSYPLWYLLSMIYSLVLIYILVGRNHKIKSFLIISIFLFAISILIDTIIQNEINSDTKSAVGQTVKNVLGSGRLFTGLLYIMIGALFSRLRKQISNIVLLAFFLIGVLLQIFKLPILSPFAFVLLPTAIFYFSMNSNADWVGDSYLFRKSSTVMYFTHMIVFFYTHCCLKKMGISDGMPFLYLLWFLYF